ncbi:two-component system sensor histidine kinase QseC [Pasteurella langaaensis DSM 22999]|uniref:histidine kinase n=1 Tax=Alitibacter langaaensis DSM 22999 TaxID=1122935 RepID=A0A2U0TCU5_9PAST|nr:ATP-binding protein [Pasteurella langaaensis]PVX41334.1 two-component system sensor histidine kinase QseC [Pasteurella langaaensis DSM 22999]
MFKSIRAKLITSLLLSTAIISFIAAGIAFYDTYRETYKQQDRTLKKIASYITSPTYLASGFSEGDDNRIAVTWIANNQPHPHFQLPEKLENEFYNFIQEQGTFKLSNNQNPRNIFTNLWYGEVSYRGYLQIREDGILVIMQENEYREELALHAAWASLMPLLVLLPLIGCLTFWVVKRTMSPIEELSNSLALRQEQDLTALPLEGVPTEITGFVQAINQLLARTRAFIEQQKRFIADAAHELRTPITALSLQAERLNNQEMSEEAKSQVQKLNQGIRRSRDLLEQLLSLARTQNKDHKDKTTLNLHNIFSRVIEDLYPLAEQKMQDLGVVSEGKTEFYANETDFYLLIKTLVDNAIRYTPAGSQIDLSAVEKDGILEIFVEDNGDGIPEQERQRVLDPFYRVLGSEQQGSGLGLAIANQIVQDYHGNIQLLDSQNFARGLMIKITFNKLQNSFNANS